MAMRQGIWGKSTGWVIRKVAGAPRAVLFTSACFLASQILGCLRDLFLAARFGQTAQTDLYHLAWILPDGLAFCFALDHLDLVLRPRLIAHRDDPPRLQRWASSVLMGTLAGVGLAVGGALGAAPGCVRLLDSGWPPGASEEWVGLVRILLPVQLCLAVGAVLMSVQRAQGHFAIPALAGVGYNLGLVGGGIALARTQGLAGFAWGALAGGLLGHVLLQIGGAWRAGWRPTRRGPWCRASAWVRFSDAAPRALVVAGPARRRAPRRGDARAVRRARRRREAARPYRSA